MNIGNIYQKLGDIDKSIEFYETAQKIYTREKMKIDLAICYSNMAGIYKSAEEYVRAFKLLLKSKDIFSENRLSYYIRKVDEKISNLYEKEQPFELINSEINISYFKAA